MLLDKNAYSAPGIHLSDKGCFVAVVGPSGAGKDTVLNAVHALLGDDQRFVFVRRVVTRKAEGEDHASISKPEFLRQRFHGAFCIDWPAHGLFYGLPRSVIADINAGKIVIANISRNVIRRCQNLFENVVVIEITADHDVLRDRLQQRGREQMNDIERRLKRAAMPLDVPEGITHICINNSGAAETATDVLHKTLQTLVMNPKDILKENRTVQ